MGSVLNERECIRCLIRPRRAGIIHVRASGSHIARNVVINGVNPGGTRVIL